MPNWLERGMARAPSQTQPGLSMRDGVTRGRDFFFRPGDGWIRNTGRIARAAAIALTTGPGGLLVAAGRNAAQGEAREGLTHLARRGLERLGSNERGAPEAPQTPSRGRRPTDPPAPGPTPPGFRPSPGMGIMPTGNTPAPRDDWGVPGQVPRFPWESDAGGDRERPYGDGSGVYPQSEGQNRRFRAGGSGRGVGVRGGEAITRNRADAQRMVESMRSYDLSQAARQAMQEMFRGAEE